MINLLIQVCFIYFLVACRVGAITLGHEKPFRYEIPVQVAVHLALLGMLLWLVSHGRKGRWSLTQEGWMVLITPIALYAAGFIIGAKMF